MPETEMEMVRSTSPPAGLMEEGEWDNIFFSFEMEP
jgi:hypothetical protein